MQGSEGSLGLGHPPFVPILFVGLEVCALHSLTGFLVGANIKAMSPASASKPDGAFHWADTPWSVAAALGIWGVMLGLDEFLPANVFVTVAAILVCVRLAKETHLGSSDRKVGIFLIGLTVVFIALGVDFWWTGKKQESAKEKNSQLAQLSQIPQLQNTIKQMTVNEQSAEKARKVSEASMQQQVSDIGADNKSLKTSIETKDAILANIAKEQYELNFAPQVIPEVRGSPEDVSFTNGGNSSVSLRKLYCGYHGPGGLILMITTGLDETEVVPQATESTTIDRNTHNEIINAARSVSDGKVSMKCTILVKTKDKRLYTLPFVWTFVIVNNAVSRSFTTAQPTVEGERQ
jgi:flagellar basal body-associated protein FliL